MRQMLCLALISALAFAGCKKKKNDDTTTTTATTTETTGSAGSAGGAMAAAGSANTMAAGSAAAPAPGGLTDPQIAAIVVAANQVDIDAGNLAMKKSKNAEVKKFAERMVTDHSAVNKSAVDLVTKLKVTPEESDVSKSLTAGGTTKRAVRLARDREQEAVEPDRVGGR